MTGHIVKIGFTGTRKSLTLQQEQVLASELLALRAYADTMVNGCCEGSDRFAWGIWSGLGGRFQFRPGDEEQLKWARRIASDNDDLFPIMDYMKRNNIIAKSDIVVATPAEEEEILRSGTWATIRRARRAKPDLYLILPSGRIIR